MDTYSYTFEEYESDVKSLRNTLSEIKNIHLVAVYRGSIPVVVHLSNLLNCEMSIIKLEISNGDTTNKEKLKNSEIRQLSDDEYNMTAIFDSVPATPDDDQKREKTLIMESSLKNAILERLKKEKLKKQF